MKVLVMTSDGGIVYDEADDNTKDFLEDWPTICNVHVHHYRNNEIKCHKFSIMHLKNKIMSYLCKITELFTTRREWSLVKTPRQVWSIRQFSEASISSRTSSVSTPVKWMVYVICQKLTFKMIYNYMVINKYIVNWKHTIS